MAGNLCRCGTYPKIEEAILYVARLIRTEKEVEGRYEEVWLVVEEDPLEQWPAGPLDGRRPPGGARSTATSARAARRRYTADLQLPGTLHTAVLRSPHAHARVRRIDLAPALARPACAPRSARARAPAARRGGRLQRRAGRRGLRRDAYGAGAAPRCALVEIEWELLEAVLDPDEAVARGDVLDRAARSERGDFERGAGRGGRRRRGRPTGRRPSSTTRSRPTARCADWVGETLQVYTSTQYIWGVRRGGRRRTLGLPPDKRARRLRVHGRRLRREERRGRLHVRSPPSWRRGPGGRCAAR